VFTIQTDIHSVDEHELTQRLIQIWCNTDQGIIDLAIEQQCKKDFQSALV